LPWTNSATPTCFDGRFIDAYSFDVRSVKKTCVHIVHRRTVDSFDTYNLFYRDDLEQTRLDPLRRLHDPARV
jgi:hypothetical protein